MKNYKEWCIRNQIIGILLFFVSISYANDFKVYDEFLLHPLCVPYTKKGILYEHSFHIRKGSEKFIESKYILNNSFLNTYGKYIPCYKKNKPCNDNINITITASSSLKEKNIVHSPGHVMDWNIKTAWVEGVKGSGYKEFIRFTLKYDKKMNVTSYNHYLLIHPGFGYSDEGFKLNNRLKSAILVIKVNYPISWPTGLIEKYGKNIKKFVAVMELFFDDVNRFQTFQIPYAYPKNKNDAVEYTLYINEVYPGSKYNDTRISEMFLMIIDRDIDEDLMRLHYQGSY